MSFFFPKLLEMSLPELTKAFVSGEANLDDPDDGELWLQELAVQIARFGEDGLPCLLGMLADADAPRLRALLIAFLLLPSAVLARHRDTIKQIFVSALANEAPLVVAQAVEGLKHLGCTEMSASIAPLVDHPSPYIAGSALRFLSRHEPEKAKPLLYEALASRNPLIRMYAVDELDELDVVEAIPRLRALSDDPDAFVRQAVATALGNLSQ